MMRNLVEPMGFEPTASSMPSRRAPNCATAPPVHNRLNFYTTWGADGQTENATGHGGEINPKR